MTDPEVRTGQLPRPVLEPTCRFSGMEIWLSGDPLEQFFTSQESTMFSVEINRSLKQSSI
jgi:hypothetical protein